MGDPPAHLLKECDRIAENSLYTAQTHFVVAAKVRRRARGWLVLLPSVVSAVAGVVVAVGGPAMVGAAAALAGCVSGVAAFLGVDRDASAHEQAGRLMTQLRDEVRALRQTYALDMSREKLAVEVRALGDRYRTFAATLPITDDAAFEKARERIKSGRFEFDAEAKRLPEEAQSQLPSKTGER